MKLSATFFMLFFLFLSCNHQSIENNEVLSVEAKYVLPYPVGREYICSQGFNNPYSHFDTFRYAVDFAMPIGTFVTAARSGRVIYILDSYSDTDQTAGHENVVIIMNEDSTYSRYVHLTHNGALVLINQMVAPGDTVGLSGSSGTNGGPHLHFDITKSFGGRSDQTIPFDFKNMIQHPIGLEEGVSYKAFPY